jgi:hypothetical protein
MKNFYLEFGGKHYFIDFEELDNFLWVDDMDREVSETETRTIYTAEGKENGSEVTKKETVNEKEINGVRYEIITGMIQTVLEYSAGDDDDDLLGAKRALEKMPFAYKLAFNTLIKYEIIKEVK